MRRVIEIVEAEVRSRPSSNEFEMTFQARVAIGRIRFAIQDEERFRRPASPCVTLTCDFWIISITSNRWTRVFRFDLKFAVHGNSSTTSQGDKQCLGIFEI
jgi:hypothetical protein